jgi:hypothetical protein
MPRVSAILRVTGMTGSFRGLNYGRPDGQTVRPSLVLIDDPQTDESAASPSQCDHRERLLSGAVLGLAGPDRAIAGVLSCTVIRPGDLADRMLDHRLHPEWAGERFKLVYQFPTNTKLWEEYREIRALSLAEGGEGAEATAFYRQHQRAMDRGAEVSWPERFRKSKGEISAVQFAQNLRFDRGESCFAAEFQNEPLQSDRGDGALTAKTVMQKVNGREPDAVPTACEHLTGFIDVHDDLLYWVICAWEPNFTGYVLAYGTYPESQLPYFQLRDATNTLRRTAPPEAKSVQAAIVAGIATLARDLLSRHWKRDDGTMLTINLILVDAGYVGKFVRLALRTIGQPGRLLPSLGRGISASNKAISEWSYEPGEIRGDHWGLFRDKEARGGRTLIFDANWWKSHLRNGLLAPLGDDGCVTLPGLDPKRHRMIADHCASEYPVRTTGRGRKLEEWKQPPAAENHYWDCLVGATVAASRLGCRLPGASEPPRTRSTPRARPSLAELKTRRHE